MAIFTTIFVAGLISHGIIACMGQSIDNGWGRSTGSWSSTADQYDALRQQNNQEFDRMAPEGNRNGGCPAQQLSFLCEFGDNLRGNLQYNNCRYYDPNPQTRRDGTQYYCTGTMSVQLRGRSCQFCCKQASTFVPTCTLRYERSTLATEQVSVPLPPQPTGRNSRRHCIGGFKGMKCNQASGSCMKYCCHEATNNPCLTPLCPADNASDEEENRFVIAGQCSYWQNKGNNGEFSAGNRGTLSKREWNRIIRANANQPHGGSDCPAPYYRHYNQCCISVPDRNPHCYTRI